MVGLVVKPNLYSAFMHFANQVISMVHTQEANRKDEEQPHPYFEEYEYLG